MELRKRPLNVFIDTSAFAACRFQLDWAPFQALLVHARDGAVVLHTTAVTLEEIRDVAARKMREIVDRLREGRHYYPELENVAIVDDDCNMRAEQVAMQIRQACRHTHYGAGVDFSELVHMYIARKAPFSTRKPDEFKDAIAALALRAWAECNGETILVVSDDGDWRGVCNESESLRLATIGQILGQVEQNREHLVMHLSRSLIVEALHRSDFKSDLEDRLILTIASEGPGGIRAAIEEATVETVEYTVDHVSVISPSEIMATVYFGATLTVDLEIGIECCEAYSVGSAEIYLSSDYELMHTRIRMAATSFTLW